MGVEPLRAALRRHKRVAFDTCIFIYQWEGNPRYSPLTNLLFSALERHQFDAVTSTITMTELLVHPYRDRDPAKVNEIFGLLSTYPNLEWVAPHLEIAAVAAEIRANAGLRTPDALQAATALQSNATAMLTNDAIFGRLSGLDVLLLDDYI